MKNFKEAYVKAKTWKELEEAIKENLTEDEVKNMIRCMGVVKESTGLDMRQDFLLGILKSIDKWEIKKKIYKAEFGIEEKPEPKFKGWKIYADIDDNGKSFTVYNNFDQCIGTFLSDAKVLEEYKAGGAKVVGGLDNRS
ncbi:MAG: hypothetical protein ACYSTX_06525 [Planctomycetota bacterium]|jgi:hypothetical protein